MRGVWVGRNDHKMGEQWFNVWILDLLLGYGFLLHHLYTLSLGDISCPWYILRQSHGSHNNKINIVLSSTSWFFSHMHARSDTCSHFWIMAAGFFCAIDFCCLHGVAIFKNMSTHRHGRVWKLGQLKAFSATAWTGFNETAGWGRKLLFFFFSGLSVIYMTECRKRKLYPVLKTRLNV